MYPRRRLITLLLTAVLSAFFACTNVADETETTEAELTATDTTYQRLRQQVAQIYYQTDQDYKAIDRAVGQLRRYCSSHGYDDGYYRAYADQILYYKNGMNFYYAEQLIDKMLEQLRRRPNDTGQQLLLYLMGSYYSVRGMDDKAEHYLLESVDYAEAHQADTDLWLVYYELANLYLGQQRYHEGMQAADRAIQAAEKTGTFQTACYSVKCQLAYRLNDGPTLNETYSRMQHLMERNHTADDDFSYYARAMHASMNGRVDEALALADSVSAIDGAQLKSELLARAGRWNEALEYETDNNWRIDSLNSFGFGEQAASLSADMDHTILEANARQARQLWVSKLSLALAAVAVLMAIILYVYVSQRRKRASQLRRLNERLYAAKREAEQDIQAKSNFIHHIGKDIRQPLDEIGQVAQRVAVADSMTDDDKRREADVMSRSIKRITDIVNRAIKTVSLVALLLTLGCGSPTLQPDVADTVTGEDASRLPRQSRELLPDEYQTLDSLRRRVAELRSKGSYRQAYGVARRYRHVSDSITQQKHALAIAAMDKVKHNAELMKRTARIKSWTHILPAVVLTLLFAIIAAFLALYAYRRRRDIDKLQAANMQLSLAARRVAEAAERKADFLRQMSHEMRTPLNAISGFSQLLLAPGMDIDGNERRDFCRRVMQNHCLMRRMVDNMVDISLLENNAVKPDMRPTPLAGLCRSAAERAAACRPDAEQADKTPVPLELRINVADDYAYVTDAGRLADMLMELLHNAMKVTRQGRVVLECGERQLSVSDTGPGIPQGLEYVIFERFEKIDSFVQGAGIGLYRCRLQAALLGVGLRVDTAYTEGARFVIDLP